MKKLALIFVLIAAIAISGCGRKAQDAPIPTPEAPAVTESPQPVPPEEAEVTEAPQSTAEDEYMASLEEQWALLKAAAQEADTQRDMNDNAYRQYALWDDALNFLWGELKSVMPEETFSALLEEQLAWIAEKEEAVAAAGKPYEGGTIYSLMVNTEAALITRDRCYYLCELLKKY